MAEALNLRSAFNGFNREDVVHYIEYLNANYEKQIKQLKADLATMQRDSFLPEANEELEERLSEMQEQFAQQESLLTALNAEKDELIAKCAQLEAVVTVLTAENKDLSDKAAQLEAKLAATAAEKDSAVAEKSRFTPSMEEELAAYRRAERVERQATERANALYRNLRASLQDTVDKADQAVANLDSISGQFNAQINTMRDSLLESKSNLGHSLFTLDELCASAAEEE